MRELADGFAASGYLVACPDLFWRQEPNVQLNDDPAKPDSDEFERALKFNAGFDDETGIADLVCTLNHLRAHDDCSGGVGDLGYCLGGRMAFLMATRTDADCSVGYYGYNIQNYLDEAAHITKPLMLNIAGADELCSQADHDKIIARLSPLESVALYEYEDAGHAFALNGGPNYDAAAAEIANQRSLEFLEEHLH